MTALNRVSVFAPGGVELSVVAAGSGPPLILIHGFPLDHRLWLNQIHHFSARWHVIAPQLRGFGASSLPSDGFSLADLADDCEFVRNHFAHDEPAVVCGLSMGGYVAFEYWARHRRQLRGLALASTRPHADSEEAQQARLEMAKVALEKGTAAAVAPMLEKLLSPHTLAHKPQVVEQVRTMMESVPPATISAAQQAMARRRDFSAQLREIDCPTFVWTGADDPLAPADSTRQWANEIPHSRFVVIPQAGHLSPVETPNEVNAHLGSFLDNLEH